MAFGQLTHRESISDTVLCLKANANKMYHLGIGDIVAISTITRANESRSFQIYDDLAMLLIKEAKRLYVHDDDLEVSLKGNVLLLMPPLLICAFLLFVGLLLEVQKEVLSFIHNLI